MSVTPTPSTRSRRALLALAAIGALAGCRGENTDAPPREFLPDMDDQPKYKAQSESHFFKEFYDENSNQWYGRSMREPVAGTVAFGKRPLIAGFTGSDYTGNSYEGHDFAKRSDYLRDDDAFFEGKAADGKYVEYMPLEVTPELVALGQEKFQIFCMPCHGGLGDGKGPVGLRWSAPLPSWHQPQYMHGGEKGQDGYIFHTIRYGVPNVGGQWELKMPSYGRKMSERESWAIVSYLRVLQKAHNGKLEELPEAERQRLLREGGKPAASADAPITNPAVAAAASPNEEAGS